MPANNWRNCGVGRGSRPGIHSTNGGCHLTASFGGFSFGAGAGAAGAFGGDVEAVEYEASDALPDGLIVIGAGAGGEPAPGGG